MSKRIFAGVALVGCLIAAAGSCAVSADLSYTLSMNMSGGPQGGGGNGPVMKMTMYYKGDEQRTETALTMPMMSMNSVTIDDCGTQKIYKVDAALGIYTVQDMGQSAPDMFGMSSMFNMMPRGMMGQSPAPPVQTGTITLNSQIVDKGMEEINGVQAHHYTVTVTQTASDGAPPPADPTTTMDIWTDDTKRPVGCVLRRLLSGAPPDTTNSASGIKYVFTGDFDKMRSVVGGVPVRMQFEGPRGRTVSMDRTDMSTDSLDDSLFAPPAGAKEVSEDEYSSDEMKAMMSRFSGHGGQAP